MNLQHTACGYHNNKVAVTLCERCRRPICLEDKRIYQQSHSTGGENSSTYYTSHDYCILCYSAQLSRQAKFSPLILVCFVPFIFIFLLGFLFIFTSSPFFTEGPFVLIAIPFIGVPILMLVGIIYSIKKTKTVAKEAEYEALMFKRSLDNNSVPYTYQKYTNSGFENPKEADFYKKRESSGFSSSNRDFNTSEAFSLVCYECGNDISIQDKFCPRCGDSTKEELEKHYSQIY